ncbi:MAG: GerMN domain-containing protein [Hormoscilla sp. GM102CHS1]|nr:GerMN domain-containing protein [Hormoscilla sp. GM102CHS1]
MQYQKSSPSISIAVVASVCTLIGVAIGGLTSWQLHSLLDHPTVTEPSVISPTPEPTVAFQTVQVYWLKDSGNSLDMELVGSPIQLKSDLGDPLEAAFHRLLAGPGDRNFTTTIPAGTRLRSVQIKSNGVHVDLSREFTTGGGTASMIGRLGQIIYTATTLQPDDRVWISVEGKPLKYLGGGGLEVEGPLTRQRFQKELAL